MVGGELVPLLLWVSPVWYVREGVSRYSHFSEAARVQLVVIVVGPQKQYVLLVC